MKTEDLIADLASRVEPVRRLPPPEVRALTWTGLAIAFAAIGIVVFQPRPDLGGLRDQPDFWILVVAGLMTAILAAGAALVLGIPGAERSGALRFTTVAIICIWAGIVIAAIARGGAGFSAVSHWYVCFGRVMAVGLVPAVALVAMLRRAAPLRQRWTGALVFVAAMAMGAAVMPLVCPIDDPGHALIGHLGPVLLTGAIGAWLGKRVFG